MWYVIRHSQKSASCHNDYEQCLPDLCFEKFAACLFAHVPALAPLEDDVDILNRHLRRVKAGEGEEEEKEEKEEEEEANDFYLSIFF